DRHELRRDIQDRNQNLAELRAAERRNDQASIDRERREIQANNTEIPGDIQELRRDRAELRNDPAELSPDQRELLRGRAEVGGDIRDARKDRQDGDHNRHAGFDRDRGRDGGHFDRGFREAAFDRDRRDGLDRDGDKRNFDRGLREAAFDRDRRAMVTTASTATAASGTSTAPSREAASDRDGGKRHFDRSFHEAAFDRDRPDRHDRLDRAG